MRRLRLVPDNTKINFFAPWAMRFRLAVSVLGMVASVVLFLRRASTTASTSGAAPHHDLDRGGGVGRSTGRS